jgi:thioredoxin-like negative regulator of GroEL
MSLENVAHIEDGDISPDGKLKINSNGKPVVVMISGNFCGYCTKFKPEFQKAVNKVNSKAIMATIVIDEEKKLGKELSNYIPKFRGVPMVVVFKNQKYFKTYEGPRESGPLIEFINGL